MRLIFVVPSVETYSTTQIPFINSVSGYECVYRGNIIKNMNKNYKT